MTSEWSEFNLKEITTKIGSGATPKGGKKSYKTEGISLIRSLNVHDGEFRVKDLAFIDEDQASKLSNVIVQEGDVLLNITGASIARCCIAPPEYLPARVNQHVSIIRPKQELVDYRFLSILLTAKEYKESLLFQGDKAGATRQALTKTQLQSFKVKLPPLPEQQRIVSILDEVFEGIGKAIANVERNLENSRELFDSYANSLLSSEHFSGEKLTLDEMLKRTWITSHLDGNHGGNYPRKNEFIDHGIPYIAANCLKNDRVDFSKAKYLHPDRAALLKKGIAQNRDVLFAHNATVGPVAILRTDEEKVILGTSLTYYRCNQNHILPEYLAHFMRSPSFMDQYKIVMRQSTRNQVPITKQRTFTHIIPSIGDQRHIAKKLDNISNFIATLTPIYLKKLSALEELKQSILQKAFTGELTAKTVDKIMEPV